MLALLIAVNYLASRRNKRWDLTANQQFSLSDQTRQILQKLDAPIKVRVFDQPAQFDRFRDRLNEYPYVSKQVSVDYIDLDKQPVEATKNQVQAYGTVVFDYKGRTERVVSSDEQQLTNGLIKVITGQQRKVYFLQGHGEKDTTSSERDGYSTILTGLQSDNFTTETLVLAQKGAVPADASVVVIAGPTVDLLPPEIDALKKYLEAGGKLVALVDPPAKVTDAPLTNLDRVPARVGASTWAPTSSSTSAASGQLIGTDESVPVAARYPAHPIVEGFRLLTAYPLARSVTPVERRRQQPDGADVHRELGQQLGRDRPGRHVRVGQGRERQGQGRAGPGAHWRRACRFRPRPRRPRRRPRRVSPSPKSRRSRRRGWSWSATPTSPPTSRSAFRATAICS